MVLRALKEEIYLQELRRSLSNAETIEDCWQVVRTACHDLSFASVQMLLNGESYEANFVTQLHEPSWTLTVSLGRRGHLKLTRTNESRSPGLMMAVLDHVEGFVREREHALVASSQTVAASGAA